MLLRSSGKRTGKVIGGILHVTLVAVATVLFAGNTISRAQGPASQPSTSQATVNEFLGISAPPTCSGSACGDISLNVKVNCVWARSRSSKPVAMTVTLANGAIDLALDAADASKSGPSNEIVHSPKAVYEDPRCEQARRSQKLLEQQEAQGVKLPPLPELDNILAHCPPEPKAAATPAETNGYQESMYDPLFNLSYPVYWGKLVTQSGCVQQLHDVKSYTANYR